MTKTPNESPTMTTHTPARIFNVETQFQKMARRSGGISRERAIERAEIEIEEVKVQFDEWLDQELAGIATAIEAARLGPDNPEWLADAAGCSRRVRDASATMRFELLIVRCQFPVRSVGFDCNRHRIRDRLGRLSSGSPELVASAGIPPPAAGRSAGTDQRPAPRRHARKRIGPGSGARRACRGFAFLA